MLVVARMVIWLLKNMSKVAKLKTLLVITLICFIVGLVSPIVTMTKFIFIENTFSVLSGTIQLFKEQQFFLFIIIAGFSVVVPLIKLGVLFKLLDMHESEAEKKSGMLDKYLHWMHLYGKWSMLDVFVVAVLVVAVKLGAIASVEMRYGLYFFAAAVLLMMILTAKVVSLQGDASR
jgi:paraquat-inducible protein A